jgi:hypothetical protein
VTLKSFHSPRNAIFHGRSQSHGLKALISVEQRAEDFHQSHFLISNHFAGQSRPFTMHSTNTRMLHVTL